MSRLKAAGDNELEMDLIIAFVSERVVNLVKKGENAS